VPRTTQEILDQADQLAARFGKHDPTDDVKDATGAAADRELLDTVNSAREEGHAWAAIGAMVGTTGEAARQRYSRPATKPV